MTPGDGAVVAVEGEFMLRAAGSAMILAARRFNRSDAQRQRHKVPKRMRHDKRRAALIDRAQVETESKTRGFEERTRAR
jgi:hypothetical protein